MNVLVVGAGAVGQVFGRALQRSGARVTFLVKPRHLDEARKGFVLYPWNEGRAPVRFTADDVVTEPGPGYDLVVLTIPTPALRAPGFLPDLVAKTGDATLLTLQPGLEDADEVARQAGAERVTVGMIGLMAYFAPLPGESLPEPGVAYWLPPFAGCPVSGPRAKAVAEALDRGGLRSKVIEDVVSERAFGGAALDALVDALEASGWDARALARDRPLRALAARAARESAAVAARARATRPPRALGLVGPFAMRVIIGVLRRLAPFDVATFFKAHYAKVATQRRALAAETQARARTLGVATPSLTELQARLAGAAAGAAP